MKYPVSIFHRKRDHCGNKLHRRLPQKGAFSEAFSTIFYRNLPQTQEGETHFTAENAPPHQTVENTISTFQRKIKSLRKTKRQEIELKYSHKQTTLF